MFKSKKALLDKETEKVFKLAAKVFSQLVTLETGFIGCTCRGLSVNPSRGDDGFLAVWRITLDSTAIANETFPVGEVGHYVIYAHGETPIDALCNLEAQLGLGEAGLTKDRYAT